MTKKLTMADIRHNSLQAVSPFFNVHNVRFNDSKTVRSVYQGGCGAFFITNDRGFEGTRLFKIWKTIDEGATIRSTHEGFSTLDAARDRAKALAKGE